MKVYKILIIIIFSIIFFAMASNKNVLIPKTRYYIKKGVGYFINKDNTFFMKIYFDKKEKAYIIDMKGKTTGWIAVGFGQKKIMKDGEIIIGYVKNGKTFLQHHFAPGYYEHKSLINFGEKRNIIELISGIEKDNFTEIKFKRKINVSGKYYKKFKPGKKINFMYAIGKTDNIKKRHKDRGKMKIMLP